MLQTEVCAKLWASHHGSFSRLGYCFPSTMDIHGKLGSLTLACLTVWLGDCWWQCLLVVPSSMSTVVLKQHFCKVCPSLSLWQPGVESFTLAYSCSLCRACAQQFCWLGDWTWKKEHNKPKSWLCCNGRLCLLCRFPEEWDYMPTPEEGVAGLRLQQGYHGPFTGHVYVLIG